MRKARFLLKWFAILLIIAVVVGALGLVIYTQIATARPEPTAEDALANTLDVAVEQGRWLVFQPTRSSPRTGLIFYPGGLVDHRSYANYGQQIAAEGYLVVIPKMPLNLAIFNVAEAGDIIASYPEIENWVIGGHSLGGVAASRFIKEHPGAIDGLVLLAAYPDESTDISSRVLDATSMYGTRDPLSTREEILGARSRLPPNTRYLPIEGGNHAQFGWYGKQRGDNPAAISHQEQQAITIQASLDLIEQVEKRKGRAE